MSENLYRTGAAARQLSISSYQLRRLCEAGLVRAEITASGQWQIPASEVARLAREGVPPLPQTQPDDMTAPPQSRTRGRDQEGTWPIKQSAAASKEVITAAAEVAITEHRLEKRKVEREAEELEDWFRERREREAERRSAHEEAERKKRAEAYAVRRRLEWEADWQRYALRSLPRDVPPEATLELPGVVKDALAKTDPSQSQYTTQALVNAAIEKVTRPWRRQKEIESAIATAVDRLPWQAKSLTRPTEWQLRATQAAREAARQLGDQASLAEVEEAARQAVERVSQEFQHRQTCQRVVSRVYVRGGSADEQELAQRAVEQALNILPVGTSERQMEQVVEQSLVPLHRQIRRREDQALRDDVLRRAPLPWGLPELDRQQAIAASQKAIEQLPEGTSRRPLEEARDRALEPFLALHARRKKRTDLIEFGRQAIFKYLLSLEREFSLGKGAWTLESELREPISKQLAQELTGDEPQEAVEERVQSLVRQNLKLPPKPKRR